MHLENLHLQRDFEMRMNYRDGRINNLIRPGSEAERSSIKHG